MLERQTIESDGLYIKNLNESLLVCYASYKIEFLTSIEPELML